MSTQAIHSKPQKVLITAGASGIGRIMALRFLRQGAKVFVIDLDASALRALTHEVSEIADEAPARLLTAVCDIGQRQAVEAVVPQAIEALGGLDVLINNAGVAGPTAPLESFDPDAWEQVMQVNLNGTFNVTRMAIPALKASDNNPSIIIMSSVAGRYGYPNRSAYSTSKWGLIGLTKTLSRELGEYGVRVNAILPGAVAGERIEKVLQQRADSNGRSLEQEKTEAMKIQSLQRFVDPEDIAAMACFLASDAGRSISGQLLPIDNDLQSASYRLCRQGQALSKAEIQRFCTLAHLHLFALGRAALGGGLDGVITSWQLEQAHRATCCHLHVFTAACNIDFDIRQVVAILGCEQQRQRIAFHGGAHGGRFIHSYAAAAVLQLATGFPGGQGAFS